MKSELTKSFYEEFLSNNKIGCTVDEIPDSDFANIVLFKILSLNKKHAAKMEKDINTIKCIALFFLWLAIISIIIGVVIYANEYNADMYRY
jgi:Ni,Fe-hydrogenase I cytochrome b subunit